ncbi:MAG: hypothetical protein KAI96_07160 [Thermodesulfovibrionia bacterium]|nr:hypothetical protein [Thermodesulfovibrionia bacterium]
MDIVHIIHMIIIITATADITKSIIIIAPITISAPTDINTSHLNTTNHIIGITEALTITSDRITNAIITIARTDIITTKGDHIAGTNV